jgi:hypothetical protein
LYFPLSNIVPPLPALICRPKAINVLRLPGMAGSACPLQISFVQASPTLRNRHDVIHFGYCVAFALLLYLTDRMRSHVGISQPGPPVIIAPFYSARSRVIQMIRMLRASVLKHQSVAAWVGADAL